MKKTHTKPARRNLEPSILLIFLISFVGVMLSAWVYSLNLKKTISASNAVVSVDVRALIEVEHIRNLVESQISNSRAFFLLGSKALLEEQKKDRQTLQETLANFEKQFSLPEVPEIIKSIEASETQQEDIFDQAMKFREKATESKIVGQFYQSKTAPIRTRMNQSLDEIVKLHNAELDRSRARARGAALGAEVQIPRGMTWLSALLGSLFFGMTLLVLKLLSDRKRQLAERTRLFDAAKKAIQARDEVIVAISQDLKEPLQEIAEIGVSLNGEAAELLKTSIGVAEGRIKDILDQTRADAGGITLRLDQLPIDGVLDEARLMLQPLAKKRDVRLQFDSVNPPALAFLDRERVMRVFSNLVGNAIKFSPKHSKVVIKVRSDQQFVYISVADNGPGIPEKQMSEIFDHFWQARETADQGAGVGLAIVKTIIEAHGGSVRVENNVGQGSIFTFSLPRRRPVGAHLEKPVSAVRLTKRTEPGTELSEGPRA
jgi:signal transduction histidine kinase